MSLENIYNDNYLVSLYRIFVKSSLLPTSKVTVYRGSSRYITTYCGTRYLGSQEKKRFDCL